MGPRDIRGRKGRLVLVLAAVRIVGIRQEYGMASHVFVFCGQELGLPAGPGTLQIEIENEILNHSCLTDSLTVDLSSRAVLHLAAVVSSYWR